MPKIIINVNFWPATKHEEIVMVSGTVVCSRESGLTWVDGFDSSRPLNNDETDFAKNVLMDYAQSYHLVEKIE